MQIREALKIGMNRLAMVGITSPSLESRILLAAAYDESQEYLLLHFDQELPEAVAKKYLSYLSRREKQEPIAYIVGVKEFYGRDFLVNNNVLIPRADTEVLIEAVLANIDSNDEVKILDLGTGSGILAVTLAIELPLAVITATDISYAALECAQQNVTKYKLDKQIILLQSDWYGSVAEEEQFDIIVSNPPYIAESEQEYMQSETKQYEPGIALYADNDGLKCYEKILSNAHNYLKPNGSIYFEIGFKQHDLIKSLAGNYGYLTIGTYKDIQEHIRVLRLISH